MTAVPSKIRVAIGADFLSAFAKLPTKQQSKVSNFLEKFRSNPTSSGINYEKINNASDDNLRSVRIDQAYRGIVLQPKGTSVYMLLWVDKHDDAYDWACRRRIQVNPHTGGLQVIETDVVEKAATDDVGQAEQQPSIPGLFDSVKDKYLLRLGVPDDLLSAVRSFKSDRDLEKAESRLPQEAAESLYMLAAGYPLEEVFAEQERQMDNEPDVDPEDFAKALEHDDSKRRFYVLADSADLGELLKAPLDKWRVFLHPTQRRLVSMHANGPVRVLGGAGTGKTVVAMHRARYLAESVFNQPGDRILFTTYTRNLADDIKVNLGKLCEQDIMRRIEVKNLDAWVHELLKKHGYDHKLLMQHEKRQEFWEKAMTVASTELELPESFYRQEWEHVIQAQGLMDERSYLRAPRTGRGQRISRMQRQQIWPVFEEYRAQLRSQGYKEFIDAMRDARILLEEKGDILNYRAVIVDEAQDMSAEAFRLIRQIVPPSRDSNANDLFIVGDAHQRIYAHKVVMGRCGIEIRGRSRRLKLNYRTTDEIARWATALLTGVEIDDLDGGTDTSRGYRALLHGEPPDVQIVETFEAEVAVIDKAIKAYQSDDITDTGICLVARSKALLNQYEAALSDRGHVFRRLEGASDDPSKPGIRSATMHRVKGLEFDVLIAAGITRDALPMSQIANEIDSPLARTAFENRERSLLYVAATRARKHALITANGIPSFLLDSNRR